jgi:hypothetical protein
MQHYDETKCFFVNELSCIFVDELSDVHYSKRFLTHYVTCALIIVCNKHKRV